MITQQLLDDYSNNTYRSQRETRIVMIESNINGTDACLGYLHGYKRVCCGHGVTKPIFMKE